MTEEEKALYSFNIPAILVMNKVDLVTSKKRLKTLQDEIEDLCDFDKIFHVSCETQFGIDALKRFIVDKG
jgi:GTPase Era involved in 16S rRNA processing